MRTPIEQSERSQTPTTVFPAGHTAARSPHCFSVGNARARYSHTAPRRAMPSRAESRAFIIRALPRTRCRKHGGQPPYKRERESSAGSEVLPPMHDFRWVRMVTPRRIFIRCVKGFVAWTREGYKTWIKISIRRVENFQNCYKYSSDR